MDIVNGWIGCRMHWLKVYVLRHEVRTTNPWITVEDGVNQGLEWRRIRVFDVNDLIGVEIFIRQVQIDPLSKHAHAPQNWRIFESLLVAKDIAQ